LVHKRSEYKPHVPIALSETTSATACKRKIIYTQRASRATTALALQKSCQHIRNTWPLPRRVP